MSDRTNCDPVRLQYCAVALLVRTAASAALTGTTLSSFESCSVGKARTSANVSTRKILIVTFLLLLGVHFAAAFLQLSAPASSFAALHRSGFGANKPRKASGAGPAMCSPVPTPVDPALASALVHLAVRRAQSDLERLGVGPARGGSVRVEYSGGTVVPDRRTPLVALGRRQLLRLKAGVRASVPAAVGTAMAAGVSRAGGTRTLLRTTAHEAVRPENAEKRQRLQRGW